MRRYSDMGLATLFQLKKWFARHVAGKVGSQLFWLMALVGVIVFLGGVFGILGGSKHPFLDAFLWVTDTGFMGDDMREQDPSPLSVMITLTGWVFMSGLFLTILVNGYERYVRDLREGRARYRFAGEHAIVLGWERMGVSVIDQLLWNPALLSAANETRCRETVIIAMRNTGEIHAMLKAQLPNFAEREKRIFILNGAFDSPRELDLLSAEKAKAVVILGDPGVPARDSRNVEAAMHIAHRLKDTGRGLPCYVHITDFRTHDLLQEADLSSVKRTDIEFHFFNFYEEWARRLWCRLPEPDGRREYPSLSFSPAVGLPFRDVHLVIVGFGFMGQALAMQAALIAHYTGGRTMKFTLIDPDINILYPVFQSHCALGALNNVILCPRPTQVEDEAIRNHLKEIVAQDKSDLTIAICLPDPDVSMATALSLPLEVLNAEVPILVRLESTLGLSALANLIKEGKSADIFRWKDIRFFGNLNGCLSFDTRREALAEEIHNAYLKRSTALWGPSSKPSGRPWSELDEKYRASSRFQADAYLERLLSNGFDLVPANDAAPTFTFTEDEVERLAEAEHNRWWAERALAGWSLGKKDDRALRSPDMIPYADLAESTKQLDRGVTTDMPAFLRRHYRLDIVRVAPAQEDRQ